MAIGVTEETEETSSRYAVLRDSRRCQWLSLPLPQHSRPPRQLPLFTVQRKNTLPFSDAWASRPLRRRFWAGQGKSVLQVSTSLS